MLCELKWFVFVVCLEFEFEKNCYKVFGVVFGCEI